MKCLKCGEENRNDAGKCFKCGTPLLWTPGSDLNDFKLKIKVSKLAIIAICLAIAGVALYLICPILEKNYGLSYANLRTFAYISFGISGSAIILGIFSLLLIEVSGGKVTGLVFSIGAILIPIIAMIFFFSSAFSRVNKMSSFSSYCGTNLSGLGKAMLIYANDYDDELPRAGGPNTTWGNSVNYAATNSMQAYGMQNGTGGSATISSSLYLLVKYCEVTPKSFLCKGDFGKGVSEFIPQANQDLITLWDFGPQPWLHNSYAYHLPYGQFPLSTSSDPGLAVAADRNPWIPSSGWLGKNFNSFNPNSNANYGNSPCHQGQGQNVLFLDIHVNFESVPFCGINEDNIYTSWNGKDIRKGTQPVLGSSPAGRTDSLLVNDPPAQKF